MSIRRTLSIFVAVLVAALSMQSAQAVQVLTTAQVNGNQDFGGGLGMD